MGIDRALDVMSSFPVDAMIDYTPQALPESPSRSPYRNPDPHEEYAARDRAARLAAARDFPDDLLPAVLRKFPPDLRARIPVDPDQKTITIYRSVPPGIDEIRPGDWVALDRGYAAQLGRGRILKKTVPLEHVMWAGTDENEWFYVPPNQPPVRQLNSARLKRRLLQ